MKRHNMAESAINDWLMKGKTLLSRINMETRAITIKCVHLGYDALIDMFQYENNSYELCDVCKGLILSGINVFGVV